MIIQVTKQNSQYQYIFVKTCHYDDEKYFSRNWYIDQQYGYMSKE